jgi:hypothetical protein
VTLEECAVRCAYVEDVVRLEQRTAELQIDLAIACEIAQAALDVAFHSRAERDYVVEQHDGLLTEWRAVRAERDRLADQNNRLRNQRRRTLRG